MKKILTALLMLLTTSFCAGAQTSLKETLEKRYENALSFYRNGNYTAAIKLLDAVQKDSEKLYPELKSKAADLKVKCQKSQKAANTFVIDEDVLDVSYRGSLYTLNVTSGKKWGVEETPDWCECRATADSLYINVARNDEKLPRTGDIVITNKNVKLTILVNQDARPEVYRALKIETSPMYAKITVDGRHESKSPVTIEGLSSGEHHLRIEKNGYYITDTLVVIPDDIIEETAAPPVEFLANLEPKFGTMHISVTPEEGFEFDIDNNAEVTINGKLIDLYPSRINEFDADDDLKMYQVYTGNLIPLSEGLARVVVTCPGFEQQTSEFRISSGEKVEAVFNMKAIVGTLTVNDEDGLASGAELFVDGKSRGFVPSRIRVKEGKHLITLHKEGFESLHGSYDVNIKEGTDTSIVVKMSPFTEFTIETTPDLARIYVDGEPVGVSKLEGLKLLAGEHLLQIMKDGYITYETTVNIGNDPGEHEFYNVSLERSHTLSLDVDDKNAYATISRGDKVYVKNTLLPADVQLPYSDSLFSLTVNRNKKVVFRKEFKFNENSVDHYDIKTWSRYNFNIFSVDLYLPNKVNLFDANKLLSKYKDLKVFYRIADLSLLQFKLFNGFSTSALKTVFYTKFTLTGEEVDIDIDDTGTTSNTGSKSLNVKTNMPLIVPALLNGEFRIGGGLAKSVDVDILLNYAYCPSFTKTWKFTHFCGIDAFAGIEFASRTPIFNANLRLGYQFINGRAAFHSQRSRNLVNTTQLGQFVVSLGFSLGTRDSKGKNILRVF